MISLRQGGVVLVSHDDRLVRNSLGHGHLQLKPSYPVLLQRQNTTHAQRLSKLLSCCLRGVGLTWVAHIFGQRFSGIHGCGRALGSEAWQVQGHVSLKTVLQVLIRFKPDFLDVAFPFFIPPGCAWQGHRVRRIFRGHLGGFP